MKARISISKIRGIGLLLWFRKIYYALWLEWAEGGQCLPSGRSKIIWIKPRIRFVSTRRLFSLGCVEDR